MSRSFEGRVCLVSCWLLALCCACADRDVEHAHAADAGQQPHADASTTPQRDRDAGQKAGAEASLDVHFLLIATFLEIERSLLARCPCLTDMGLYETRADCNRAVGLGHDWVACANMLDLSQQDSEQVRATLRCNVEELSQRSECLMGSACREEAIAACMTDGLGCPMLPLNLFSEVATECRIALSH
jgi:hypothetical protein